MILRTQGRVRARETIMETFTRHIGSELFSLQSLESWHDALKGNNPVITPFRLDTSHWQREINKNNRVAVYDTSRGFSVNALRLIQDREVVERANLSRKPFARIFHLFVFPGLREELGRSVWETIEVSDLTSADPRWKIRAVATTSDKDMIGRVRNIPQSIIEEYGAHVERSAFRGTRMDVWVSEQPGPFDTFIRKFGDGSASCQVHEQKMAKFGSLMWKWIESGGTNGLGFCQSEMSEEILPLAAQAGLCSKVTYDPEIHGDIQDAEPGSEIWWWGNKASNALLRSGLEDAATFHKASYVVDVLSRGRIPECFALNDLAIMSEKIGAVSVVRELYQASLTSREMSNELLATKKSLDDLEGKRNG